MPASPAMSVPPISPGEMQLLLSRAGLVLNPGQVADLVLAWRQMAGLIAAMPHDRPLVDDLAYAFRLPPPGSAAAIGPAQAPRAPAKPQRKSKPKAKAKAHGRPQAKPKRKARPPARKGAQRRR